MSDIRFSIDVITENSCEGWIIDLLNQDEIHRLYIYINNELVDECLANFYRGDLSILGVENCHHGFFVDILNIAKEPNFRLKIICRPRNGTEIVLVDKLYVPFYAQIEFLSYIQNQIRSNIIKPFDGCKDSLLYYTIPKVIDYLRCDKNSKSFLEDFDGINTTTRFYHERENEIDPRVSIIIPIYKGLAETKNCLLSVLKAKCAIDYKLILISDKSPDVNMLPMLRAVEKVYSNVELYCNEENLGFVGTVNRGMKIAQNSDVVLLNSDTIVLDNWLDGLYYEAYKALNADSVGTVTPLSNNATICSFPAFNEVNEVLDDVLLGKLGDLCIQNKSLAVDIPTAHGFCMYIKRQVINEVGLFNQEVFAKGYGEENDFSLRASKLGWRNVATNKSFVLHVGSVSFSENALRYQKENLDKLNHMYPDYQLLIQNFLKKDPVRLLRLELGTKLLIDSMDDCDKVVLMVCPLNLGGGTMTAIKDLVSLLALEGIKCLLISQLSGEFFRISTISKNIYVDIHIYKEKDILTNLLKNLNIVHIHYHHTIDCDHSIWMIPDLLSIDYDVTLHDYYTICPRANLMSYEDEYCGDQSSYEKCNQCLKSLGVHSASRLSMKTFGDDIKIWRQYFFDKLVNARRVIVPSVDMRDRVLRFMNLKNIKVAPHPERSGKYEVNIRSEYHKINIGFLGAIGSHKGLKIIKNLCRYIKSNKEDVDISIIGYTSDDSFFVDYDFVTIAGKYQSEDLPKLISESQIDVIFVSSIIPETYSYAYTEAVRSGLPIVAYNLGAIPERSKDNPYVKIIDINLDMACLIREIKEFLTSLKKVGYVFVGRQYQSIWADYYEK